MPIFLLFYRMGMIFFFNKLSSALHFGKLDYDNGSNDENNKITLKRGFFFFSLSFFTAGSGHKQCELMDICSSTLKRYVKY